MEGGGEESCGETSPDMKEDDKSAKPDAEWKKEEERQEEGGGRRNSRVTRSRIGSLCLLRQNTTTLLKSR